MRRSTVILDEPCAPLRDAVAEFAPVLVFKSVRGFRSHPHLLVGDLLDAQALAGVAPPYVFASASFGGFAALDYAHRYPERLAGLVLVDASHPDQGPAALAAIPANESLTPELRAFKRLMEGFGPVWDESCAAIRRIDGLGDLPLRVLAAGQPDLPAGLGLATREALTQGWHGLQRRHAALSTRGTVQIIPGAGHDLVRQAPEAVVAAIRELVVLGR